ncbi:MAG: threonine synthase [Myxococcales bacterium]
MTQGARFACFERCGETYPLTDVIYRCRRCGSLLDVDHDLAALRQRDGAAWRSLFEERWRRTDWFAGSGVWGKLEWVYPGIAPSSVVTLGEGATHLMPVPRFARAIGVGDVRVKLCGNSHTGSFKDLGMTVLVSAVVEMRSQGVPVRAVACASTGDTSAALAAFCAVADIPAIVFLPRGKVSTAQLVQPLANGAHVLALDTDFDGCMRLVQEVTADGSIYLANSMNSLRLEGQKTAAIEILQQLGWQVPDWVVIPGGNLGNVYAFGRGFQLARDLGLVDRTPRLVCAQAALANPLYRAFEQGFATYEPMVAGDTQATAIRIGAPVSIQRAIRILRELDGIVEQATEDELANAAALGDLAGLYDDPHTGVALAATANLVRRGVIEPHHRTVVVSTAHGLKFTEHKVRYHEGALPDVTSRHGNRPLELPADPAAVRAALARLA